MKKKLNGKVGDGLEQEDWDFSGCPKGREYDCWCYEFAREVPDIVAEGECKIGRGFAIAQCSLCRLRDLRERLAQEVAGFELIEGHRGIAADHGQRRAELVRGIRHEVLAHRIQPRLTRDVAHQQQREAGFSRRHEIEHEPAVGTDQPGSRRLRF